LPSDDDHKNVDLLIRELTVSICMLLVTDQAAAFRNGKSGSFEKVYGDTYGGGKLNYQ
jgi:hypothetical protein